MDKTMTAEYKPNHESSENMVAKMVQRYETRGAVMPPEQREIYQKVSEMVTGLTVIDVGCGLGIGANIISREARFTWGIDKDPKHIDFANQMFERKTASGLGQLNFEVFDLTNPPSREFGKFHVITCIDVLEHIEDYQKALNTLKRFYDPARTTLILSTPNRNADKFKDNQDHPWNPHHIREWSAAEAYDIMIKNFQYVTVYDWKMDKTLELDTKITPIIFKIEGKAL